MKRKVLRTVGVTTLLLLVVALGVHLLHKDALAWPTHVTLTVTDGAARINGIEFWVEWLDGVDPVDEGFPLINNTNGIYFSPSWANEPPANADGYRVTFQDGNGFVPQAPDAWEVDMPIDNWGGENGFNWEVEPE